jgi:signal transduction histidine kinase
MKVKFIYPIVYKVFGDMTIRRKLVSVIMLASTLSLVLVGAAFIFWQWFTLRQSMVRSLSIQARVIASNCEASITFEEPKDANDVLKALKSEPSIVFGGIYTLKGEMFASYYRKSSDKNVRPDKPRLAGHFFEDDLLTVYEPVIVENRTVGIVCLRSTLSDLGKMFGQNIAVIVGCLSIVSVLIFFVSAELQKIISEPILELADVAKAISEKQEYSIRVKKYSKDEVGLLIKAFNEMLAQIQKRDSAMSNTNAQLEKKVAERTKDLQEEVSVRRKAEHELAQTVKKLTLSNRELQEFTRVAAHDLQTPLRAIGILSDWIAEDYARKFNERNYKNTKLLQSRAQRMSRLLYAMIQYSEVSLVGKKQESLDLNSVLSKVISMINPAENIEIVIENELPVIFGVRKFMEELFENLINNSVRYMDKPKGVIKVGCVEEDDFWKFSVSDNGPGIEGKYFDKVFEIFQMLSLRDETESIGIGLSIVKKIVELYDGRIWIESQVGDGTTFFFTFPKSSSIFQDYVDTELEAALA